MVSGIARSIEDPGRFPANIGLDALCASLWPDARATTLDNVRQIANAAAAVWAKEGVAAGLREDRKLSTRAFAEAHLLPKEPPTADYRGLSENPDRGHADPR